MFNNLNSLINISSIAIGVIGIILTIVVYFKSKKTQKISIKTSSIVLISEKLSQDENLKIFYNDIKINSLISTTIKIVNSGTDTIKLEDFIDSFLTLKTTGTFLLDDPSQYEILPSVEKNTTTLKAIDKSSVNITFKFLNPKDYMMIRVLHTGEISIDGTLIKNPENKYTQKSTDSNDIIDHESLSLIMQMKIFLLAMCPFLMLISIMIDAFRANVSNEKIVFYLICLLIINLPLRSNNN